MWLHNGKTGSRVLVTHPDTLARCLSEGWVEIADPHAPVPDVPPPDPEAEQATLAAVKARNDAARKAFSSRPKGRR